MLGKGPLFVGKIGDMIGGKDAAHERETLLILHEHGKVRIAELIFRNMFFDERCNGGKFLLFVEHGERAHAFGRYGLARKLFGGIEPFGKALCVLA